MQMQELHKQNTTQYNTAATTTKTDMASNRKVTSANKMQFTVNTY